MNRMTIQEVYKECLLQGSRWRKDAELLRGKDDLEELTLQDYADAKADSFYDCAMWLERTEEINPTK